MPAKNSIKQYSENSYYHIYNRGVEKRKIFKNSMDYSVFLSYIKEYLTPKNERLLRDELAKEDISSREKDNILRKLRMNNFADEITLVAYCLMPNHFHLLIKQKARDSIDKFMSSMATRYTMYFNKKYKRVGSLYQGVYKAVLVDTEEQLLHLTRYIHRNPLILASKGLSLQEIGQPSSYIDYLGLRKTEWVKPDEILRFFSNKNTGLNYESFVAESDDYGYNSISNLILDEDLG